MADKEKKDRPKKRMKRGWILVFSVVIQTLLFSALYYPLSFFSTTLGAIVGTTGLLICGFLLVYFWWAPNNLFFTFVPEGRAKIVVRGDAFKKVLMQWENYGLATKTVGDVYEWDIVEKPTKRRLLGGLKFYGFWPIDDIYIYDFSWTGIGENGEVQLHAKETIDYILVKDDVYWCRVEKCEDKELLPLDAETLLTIKVVNPYKALFVVQNWLETVVNRTKPLIRNEITKKTYEKLTSSKKAIGAAIWRGSKALRKEFWDRYGVELRQLEVKEIDPPENLRETTLRRFIAQKTKEAAIVEAEGEAKRIRTVNEAIKEFGDLGQLRTVLDALEKSPEKGAKWIIPLPGMTDFFARVFPGKGLSTLSSDDINDLKEIIEKFRQNNQGKKAS